MPLQPQNNPGFNEATHNTTSTVISTASGDRGFAVLKENNGKWSDDGKHYDDSSMN